MSSFVQEIYFEKTDVHTVYETLVDSAKHAEFTKAEANIPRENGAVYDAYDKYIDGKILLLVQDQLIVKTWRLKDWPAGVYSRLTLDFAECTQNAEGKPAKTKLTLLQAGIPAECMKCMDQSWHFFYWDKLKKFLGEEIPRPITMEDFNDVPEHKKIAEEEAAANNSNNKKRRLDGKDEEEEEEKTEESAAAAVTATASSAEEKPQPNGKPLCHADIPAKDLARAAKFYTDVFEWECQPWGDDYIGYKTAKSEYGYINGGFYKLAEGQEQPQHRTITLYLQVDNIEAYEAKIKQHGGEVTKSKFEIAPGAGFSAHFKDTEGNHMAVWAWN